MLRDGIISYTISEWSSYVVLVNNKDSIHRFCCDYRTLNDVTRSVSYPLLRIEDILNKFGKTLFIPLVASGEFFSWKMPRRNQLLAAI